jgi:hypothetical protein
MRNAGRNLFSKGAKEEQSQSDHGLVRHARHTPMSWISTRYRAFRHLPASSLYSKSGLFEVACMCAETE